MSCSLNQKNIKRKALIVHISVLCKVVSSGVVAGWQHTSDHVIVSLDFKKLAVSGF